MEDGSCHIAREGQAAQLVVHDDDLVQLVVQVVDAIGEPLHRLDEVASLADDPGVAHDVVARAPGPGDVAGRVQECGAVPPGIVQIGVDNPCFGRGGGRGCPGRSSWRAASSP